MIYTVLSALIQSAPAPSPPPPPIQPVVAWVNQVGNVEKVHFVLLAPSTTVPIPAPDELYETLTIGKKTIPVTLTRDGPPVFLPANSYIKIIYSLRIPSKAAGEAVLITDLSDTGGFWFQVHAVPTE